jgi:hypothetical protein
MELAYLVCTTGLTGALVACAEKRPTGECCAGVAENRRGQCRHMRSKAKGHNLRFTAPRTEEKPEYQAQNGQQ